MKHGVENCPCSGKKCTQCKVLKCRLAFHKTKDTSGIASACKECVNTKRRLKRQENLEEVRAYHRAYRQAHEEELNATRRRHYQEKAEQRIKKATHYRANSERIKSLRKEYQQTHAEEIKEYKKNRYQTHAEDFKQQKKEYYQEKAESIREAKKSHRKTNPSLYSAIDKAHFAQRRARKLQAEGQFSPQEWLELKEKYNFTCLRCGRKEPEIRLSADHVVPLAKGGTNKIDNIQPLCISCNSIKYTEHIDYRTGEQSNE